MSQLSWRGFAPLGIFAVLNNRLKSATGKRFKRFVVAAAVAVTASQITLTLCLGVFGLPAGVSGFTAWFAGAAASYLMSRWAWERKGRPDLLKETLPFWLIAMCVALILTTTTKIANDFALSAGFSHTQRILFVDAVYFLANCVTFAARFLIFHYILFKEKQPERSSKRKKSAKTKKASTSVLPDSFTKLAGNHPGLFKVTVFAAPFIIYLICSLIYLHPPSLAALHDDVFNSSPDPQQFVWFMNWWPYALTHHLNPFVTHYAWYPNGYNLTWATSIPALAYIMAPVTWIGGATLSFNLLALLGPPLAALTCFWLIYSISKSFVPSLLGGYIYGFSTYQMGQLVGHPHMYFDFLIPVIVLLGWRYFNRTIKTTPYIALTAVLLAVQFGISTEIFATLVVFATIAAIVFYVFYRQPEIRGRLRTVMLHFYGALAVSLVLVSPYLYFILSGYNKVPGELHSLATFSSDALNFVVPTAVTQFGGRHFLNISLHFLGNFSEDGAYIGLPFAVLLIYIAIKYHRKTLMLALSVLLGLIMLFSLGPKLHIAGHTGHIGSITGIPLPWIIPSHLPLIKSALPDRFTMYMFLVIAVIIGLWLSLKTSDRNRNLKYGAVLLGIAFIVPTPSQYLWSKVGVPAVFNKSHVSSYIPQNSNVIILPYGRLGSDMYYQYASGMWFTQSGGYVGAVPSEYTDSTVLASFLSANPQPNFSRDLAKFCTKNKVSKIIYLPGTAPALVNLIKSLGWPARKVQGATVVGVPNS